MKVKSRGCCDSDFDPDPDPIWAQILGRKVKPTQYRRVCVAFAVFCVFKFLLIQNNFESLGKCFRLDVVAFRWLLLLVLLRNSSEIWHLSFMIYRLAECYFFTIRLAKL
jgi:hypothetical protein